MRAVLFQYPPWFACMQENVRTLRETKKADGRHPCALEFRHQSWFAPESREKTLAFIQRKAGFIAFAMTSPLEQGSVPNRAASHSSLTLRLYGCMVAMYRVGSSGAPNWREVRYLYNYNDEPIVGMEGTDCGSCKSKRRRSALSHNNSGGHAAGTAKTLMRLLGLPTPAPHIQSNWTYLISKLKGHPHD